jgi:anti-sigma B factor antagonist
MAIKVTCPNGHVLQVKDSYAGHSGLCPHCHARVEVSKPARGLEDEVLDILGPPKTPLPRPSAQAAHHEPRHDAAREESGISLLGSTLPRRKKVCPQCCEFLAVSVAACPRCGTPLSDWTVPVLEETPRQLSEGIYHYLGVRRQGEVVVIRFGEHRILDEAAVEKIGNELHGVADRANCHNLLLNFASVVSLTSLMLGNLLLLKKNIEAKGGKLRLCQVAPEIREIFAATKLGQIFDIQESEQDALRAFAASPPTNDRQQAEDRP